MAKKHRDYPDNEYPSVTTVIGQLNSFALMHWFKITPYAQILEETARGRAIGTQMHQCIQDFIETGTAKINTEFPDEITTALRSFQLFKKENPNVVLRKSEKALSSLKYGFNGTVDCYSDDMIVDWKSSKAGDKDKPTIYEEAKTQVSAYLHLVNEIENTTFEKCLIVAIAKDKVSYNTYEMLKEEIEGQFNEVFLPLLKIWKYKNHNKKKEPKDAV